MKIDNPLFITEKEEWGLISCNCSQIGAIGCEKNEQKIFPVASEPPTNLCNLIWHFLIKIRFVFTHITQTQTQSRKSALDLFKFMQILNMGPFWFVLLPLLEVGIETLKVVQNFFMISRLRERGGFSLHGFKHTEILKWPQFMPGWVNALVFNAFVQF